MKKNKTSRRRISAAGAGVMASSFLAVFLITVLCLMFYNLWQDDIRRLGVAEGGWHLRLAGSFDEAQLGTVRAFAHVSLAQPYSAPDAPGEGVAGVEICFAPPSAAPKEGPLIASALGLQESAVQYHADLLALYLVRAPGDDAPRMLLPMYLAILAAACCSLVLLIHNAFAVSMNNRVREIGVLSGIGATPGQLLRWLMREALALTALPVLAGLAAGLLASRLWFDAMLRFAASLGLRQDTPARFCTHPALFAATLAAAFGTVLLSALLPAWRASRLTPLEAMRTAPAAPRKPRFGRGKGGRGAVRLLAAGALRAQRRALWGGSLSLTLAFLGFLVIQCFFTLSDISTRYTYFARYQDAWDVMLTLSGGEAEGFALAGQLQSLAGVRSCAVYRRAEGTALLPPGAESEELKALGGYTALAGADTGAGGDALRLPAELVILDDAAFCEYCAGQGLEQRPDGAVLDNRIWDSLHSNFRYRAYVPFVKETGAPFTLEGPAGGMELPVLGYAQSPPLLREEYEAHSLTVTLPYSLWRQLGGDAAAAQPVQVRLLAAGGAGLAELDALETAAVQLVGPGRLAGSENRIRDEETNSRVIAGFRRVLGAACAYLALIGLAGVFAHTMGFVRLRRREIARYESIGMTPAQLYRMFALEALTLAGRPLLTSLVLGGAAVGFMIRASYLDPAEFLAEAPVLPVLAFALAVFLLVGLAYWLGSRALLRTGLAEALRSETLD